MKMLPFRCVAAALCLSAAMLTACKPSNPPPPTTAPAAQNKVYDMRGVIERLGTDRVPRELLIHHEATTAMESMTMPFVIDKGVPLTGLAVGDKVSFRLVVDAKSDVEHVTRLDKLPADTVLHFPGAP